MRRRAFEGRIIARQRTCGAVDLAGVREMRAALRRSGSLGLKGSASRVGRKLFRRRIFMSAGHALLRVGNYYAQEIMRWEQFGGDSEVLVLEG